MEVREPGPDRRAEQKARSEDRDRRPSVTAALVASTLLVSGRDPNLAHLVEPSTLPLVERAVRDVIPELRVCLDRIPWPVLVRAARVAERVFSPGFIAHYALRKDAVRQRVREAIANGFTQVVLLGAGFDMLADGLPVQKTVRIFEVDQAATLEAKRRALGGKPSRHVTHVTVDLARESLASALARAPRFDARADTVFVAEGLLMYLEPARVDAILAEIAATPARRTRLVVTVVTPDVRGRVRLHTQHRLVDFCMRCLDETFQWGASRDDLPRFLAAHGFVLREVCSTAARVKRDTGELVLVADDAVASVTDERVRTALAS